MSTDPTGDDVMPVFTIKAKDALALQAVIAYRDLCTGHGLDAQAEQVQLALMEIMAWRTEHEDQIRMPDHKHVPAAPSATLPAETPAPRVWEMDMTARFLTDDETDEAEDPR